MIKVSRFAISVFALAFATLVLSSACGYSGQTETGETLARVVSSTSEPTATPTATATPAPTHTPEPTLTPSPTPMSESEPVPTTPSAAVVPKPTATSPTMFDVDKMGETQTPAPTPPAALGVEALQSYRNGPDLMRSSHDLAESIVETRWIADGIAASESVAVEEIVNVAAFHRGLARSVLALGWYDDGLSETELQAISHLAAIADGDELTAAIVATLDWFGDGVSESEGEDGRASDGRGAADQVRRVAV